MAWQDTLRDLDDRLADGDITSTEHRRLRDEALAEASGETRRIAADSPVFLAREELPEPVWHYEPRFVDGEALFAGGGPVKRSRVLVGAMAVAAVGVGVWWLLSPSDSEPVAAPVAPPVSAAEELMGKLPALPGTVVSPPAVLPTSLGPQLGLYSREIPDPTSSGLVNTSAMDGPRSLAVNVLDNGTGPDHTQALLSFATTTGWADAPASATDGVHVVGAADHGAQRLRAVYRSGRWTVSITVSGPEADQLLRPYLDAFVSRTRIALPAG
ncbi:hypothetical protein [Actinokineospora enzanensis]|uniref:hypothetical protein n=1 Tax=Actinokineospora enzanensis TaxID=155975 RepID=UPI000370D227|nr:hypothetical protein [Actinokineospora enzanensis]